MVARRNVDPREIPSSGDGRRAEPQLAIAGRAKRSLSDPIRIYFDNHPAAVIAVAFAGGVILGWLVKRR